MMKDPFMKRILKGTLAVVEVEVMMKMLTQIFPKTFLVMLLRMLMKRKTLLPVVPIGKTKDFILRILKSVPALVLSGILADLGRKTTFFVNKKSYVVNVGNELLIEILHQTSHSIYNQIIFLNGNRH